MTDARSTQGYTIRMDTESALGTEDGGLDKEIRLAAAPTLPGSTVLLQEQDNLGHENASDMSDKPIPYKAGEESSLTLPIRMRRGAADAIPTLMYMMRSGGYTITDSVADTVTDVGPLVGDFDCTASLFGVADAYGGAVLVETVASSTWTPSLLASYDDAPDKTCIPVMDLPAIAAAGGAVIRMNTATVNPAVVGAADTLTFVTNTRGDYSDGTGADYLAFKHRGCALADLGDIVIDKEGALTLSPVFHVTDTALLDEILDAADFLEGDDTDNTTSSFQRNETSNFNCLLGAFAAAGGIAFSTAKFLSATIRTGVTSIPVDAIGGSSGCLNGWQGFMQKLAAPECDLQILLDSNYIDDATSGYQAITANQDLFLGFTWATSSLDVVSSGMWLPRCYQFQPATLEPFGEKYQLMTIHLKGTSPKYTGSATSNGSPGMSPFVMSVHGKAT